MRSPLWAIRGRVFTYGDQDKGDRVVQIPLGSRTYAYIARNAEKGDLVEVHGRGHGWSHARVVGFGRGGYRGPLKRARVLR